MSIIKLFCDVDDFCQEFAPLGNVICWQMDYASAEESPLLSLSEVMTIMIHFHQSGYRTFKHYYLRHVQQHLRSEFPKLVSYTTLDAEHSAHYRNSEEHEEQVDGERQTNDSCINEPSLKPSMTSWKTFRRSNTPNIVVLWISWSTYWPDWLLTCSNPKSHRSFAAALPYSLTKHNSG